MSSKATERGAARHLRAATPQDLPALTALQAHERGRWDHAALASELTTAWSQVWVLEAAPGPGEDSTVLGFLVFWRVANELQLLNITVRAPSRRQGHGRFMLEALKEHARVLRLERVVLEVRRGNGAARQLYTQCGFVVVGERRGYYADTGEDAILMEQHIL